MNSEMYAELVNGILQALKDTVVSIVLYGSVARGTDTAGSDIDIAVIIKQRISQEENSLLSDFIVDMNLKYDKVFSVVDIEKTVFQQWKDLLPFYKSVSEEGIVLWTAA